MRACIVLMLLTATCLGSQPLGLALYPTEGAPDVGGNNPYPRSPAADSVLAGDSLPIVAKVFDANDVWLSEYEADTAPISWHIVEVSGIPPSGTLSADTGHSTEFVATRAYNTVEVVATLSDGGINLSADVRVFVVPGTPYQPHLVIEASPDPAVSPNVDNPLEYVSMGCTDSVAIVYAVVRDQFGNFVHPASSVVWTSLDSTVVTVTNVSDSLGAGEIRISGLCGRQTGVVASWGGGTPLRDTVLVAVSLCAAPIALRLADPDGAVGDTIQAAVGDTLALKAQGISVGGLPVDWRDARVRWSVSGGLALGPPPDSAVASWTFSVAATGTGWVWVRCDVPCQGTVSDSVWLIVGPQQGVLRQEATGARTNDATPRQVYDLRGRRLVRTALLPASVVIERHPSGIGTVRRVWLGR